LIRQALGDLPLRAATGDIGIRTAAVDGLRTTPARKAELRRHIRRPRRFRALLDRYSGSTPVPETRLALLARPDPLAGSAPLIGLRDRAEIETRIVALRADAGAPPLSRGDEDPIGVSFGVREMLPFALGHLRDLSVDLSAIVSAVARLAGRPPPLAARGVDVEVLEFEASFRRTSMEY